MSDLRAHFTHRYDIESQSDEYQCRECNSIGTTPATTEHTEQCAVGQLAASQALVRELSQTIANNRLKYGALIREARRACAPEPSGEEGT